MNAHVSKPVDMKILEKTIRSIKSGVWGGVPEAMEKVPEVYEMTIEEIKKGLSH